MPNSRQLFAQRVDLLLRDRIGDRQTAVAGWHVVVGGGDGLFRPADATPGQAQTFERLRAGHLVDEVQIDVQDRLSTCFGENDVFVPDFFKQRAEHGGRSEW